MVLVNEGSTTCGFARDLLRLSVNDPTFQALDWAENSLDAADATLLAKALDGNTHLQTITLRYGIYMSTTAAERLEFALIHTCVVRAVLVGRSYSHDGCVVIRDRHHTRHTAVVRQHCVANAARRAAMDDPSLGVIDWSNNEAGDDDLAVLAPSLRQNTQLQRISLSNNRGVTDRGASLLALALPSSRVVRVDIDGCHCVGRDAAAALRRVWVQNTVHRVMARDVGLNEVDWSNTEADDEDLCLLADALRTPTPVDSVVHLNSGRAPPHATLLPNDTVTALQLAHNRLIGDVGAAALQSALSHCGVVVVSMDVTSVGERRKSGIRRLCVANAAKRLAAVRFPTDLRLFVRLFVRLKLANQAPACITQYLHASVTKYKLVHCYAERPQTDRAGLASGAISIEESSFHIEESSFPNQEFSFLHKTRCAILLIMMTSSH